MSCCILLVLLFWPFTLLMFHLFSLMLFSVCHCWQTFTFSGKVEIKKSKHTPPSPYRNEMCFFHILCQQEMACTFAPPSHPLCWEKRWAVVRARCISRCLGDYPLKFSPDTPDSLWGCTKKNCDRAFNYIFSKSKTVYPAGLQILVLTFVEREHDSFFLFAAIVFLFVFSSNEVLHFPNINWIWYY